MDKILIGSDHGGYNLKNTLIEYLKEKNFEDLIWLIGIILFHFDYIVTLLLYDFILW